MLTPPPRLDRKNKQLLIDFFPGVRHRIDPVLPAADGLGEETAITIAVYIIVTPVVVHCQRGDGVAPGQRHLPHYPGGVARATLYFPVFRREHARSVRRLQDGLEAGFRAQGCAVAYPVMEFSPQCIEIFNNRLLVVVRLLVCSAVPGKGLSRGAGFTFRYFL